MKKIILLMLAVILMAPAAEAGNKQLKKAQKKEYKEKIKEYQKGKWELFGSSHTLEVALLNHYDQLNTLGADGSEVVGIASRFKSKNIGHQQAINNACLTYAQQAGSKLKGRIVSDMAANGDDSSAEFDHFYAAYERLVEKEIKGERLSLTASFVALILKQKTKRIKNMKCRHISLLAKVQQLAQEFAQWKMPSRNLRLLKNMQKK